MLVVNNQEYLDKVIAFAKENGDYAPPTERLWGTYAIRRARMEERSPSNVMVQVNVGLADLKEFEVHWMVGRELLRLRERESENTLTREQTGIYLDVPVPKSSSTMYLTEALDYLEKYGGEHSRVTIGSDRGDGNFYVSFEKRRDENHKYEQWMNGGLIYHHRDDPDERGWSVHT